MPLKCCNLFIKYNLLLLFPHLCFLPLLTVLVLAQIFGVFPVAGVWPSSPVEKVHFRWLSPSLLVSCISLGFAILDCVLSSNIILEHGLKIYTIGEQTQVYLMYIHAMCFFSSSGRLAQFQRHLHCLLYHVLLTLLPLGAAYQAHSAL